MLSVAPIPCPISPPAAAHPHRGAQERILPGVRGARAPRPQPQPYFHSAFTCADPRAVIPLLLHLQDAAGLSQQLVPAG